MDRGSGFAGGAGDGARRECRLAMRIAGGEKAGTPIAGQLRDEVANLSSIQQSRSQAKAASDCQCIRDACFIIGGFRGNQDAPRSETCAGLAVTRGDLDPEAVRFGSERHLRFVAALLADETPSAAGLLGGDLGALEHRDLDALGGQMPSGGAAHDAGTDDGDVHRFKRRLVH